jgi:hypothetical protein
MSGPDDLLESGSRRAPMRMPAWRPPKIAILLGAAGLIVGLAAGYAAGNRQAAKHAPAPARTAAAPPVAVGDLPLAQAGPQCSAQIGPDLQLGMQVTNISASGVTLRGITAVIPLGGLRAIVQAWGTCGELPEAGQGPGPTTLPAGASTWFTVTFRVLMRCPQPLPVEFTVHYVRQGRPGSVHLPGFPDLGHVPYRTCAHV